MTRFWAGATVIVVLSAISMAAYVVDKEAGGPRSAADVIERQAASYRLVLAENPRNSEARFAIATVYADAGQEAKAIRELKKIVSQDPDYAQALFKLGQIYEEKGSLRRAQNYWLLGTRVDRRNEMGFYGLGRLALKLHDYPVAIRSLRRALTLKPRFADAHYDLARAYEATGRLGSARREYERAIKYIPDYKQAQTGLERVSRGSGEDR